MKIFPIPHAIAGYIEHVAPATPEVAERRIRTAQILFRTLSRDHNLALYGCRDSTGRKFILAADIATLCAECVTAAATHPYWFYRETKPLWKAAGLPVSRGNSSAKRARKRLSLSAAPGEAR